MIAAAALIVFTNGPILLLSKSVLDRSGRWEDPAVWPWLAAAAGAGAGLVVWDLIQRRRVAAAGSAFTYGALTCSASTDKAAIGETAVGGTAASNLRTPRPQGPVRRRGKAVFGNAAAGGAAELAAVGVVWFTLAALASALWSVDASATFWRSCIYAGMALLAWAMARFDARELSAAVALMAAAAVAASLLLIVLRPDLGVAGNDRWTGVYTNPNSLAPLAGIGVLAGARWALTLRGWQRMGSVGLGLASIAALFGAGSRTAWAALIAACAMTSLPLIHKRVLRRHGATKAAASLIAAAGVTSTAAAAFVIRAWNEPTFSQRREIWRLVWDRILERPLTGHGFFTFWNIEELTQHVLLRRGSAHNSLIEVALGLGLLGVAPFVVIVVLAARNTGSALWRRPGADTWMQAALVVFLLVESLTESFVLWFSYSWVLLMAAALRPAPEPVYVSASPDGAAETSAAPGASDLGRSQPASGGRVGAWSRHRRRKGRHLDDRRRRSDPMNGRQQDVRRSAPIDFRARERADSANGRQLSDWRRKARRVAGSAARLRSGWTVVALISLAVLLVWLPDLNLPLGNSDDGRILARFGLQGRNFWDLGAVESRFGAVMQPFFDPEYGVMPGADPPAAAVTYAHHPPLQIFITIASLGLLGDNLAALRVVAFAVGAATVVFMAALLRVRGLAWGPTLLAVTVMVCTGFFYVYARIGVGFSLLAALLAAVAWLRSRPRAPAWALTGAGVLAALTAMQSWIALMSTALMAAWLFFGLRRPESPSTRATETEKAEEAEQAEERGTQNQQSREPPTQEPPGRAPSAATLKAGGLSAATLRLWPPKGGSRALAAVCSGAAVGALITAAWLLNATDVAELAERTAFRFGNDVSTAIEQRQFSFGEFLSRQWNFASHEQMAPLWLRVLLAPALLAGLLDRRTRVPVLITLAGAAALTFGFQQGAWVHRLWNFPWLAPATIGMAALFDAVRRALRGPAARLRLPAAALAATIAAGTLVSAATGETRDFYLTDPAEAGELLAQLEDSHTPRIIWQTPGISTARWASYYLDAPVFALSEDQLEDVAADDLVLVRIDRAPDYLPETALNAPLVAGDAYMVLKGATLNP